MMRNWWLILFFIPVFVFGQNLQPDEFLWNKSRKLKKEDYKIIVYDKDITIRSSINFSWQLAGFSVFNKNFNQNVQNKFFGNSSAINPEAHGIDFLLEYQQTNFDLAEIYARKMRRELLINKNKLWKGFDYANLILNQISSDFIRVQMIMDKETNHGNDLEQLKFWQQKIKNELDELSDFVYDNTSKIKIKENYINLI